MFQEVLAKERPEVRRCLLISSIFDRFCPQVLDVVFETGPGSASHSLDGQDFVDMLQRSTLFVTSLDARGHWFRYHKIFKQLLGRQIQRELPTSEIAKLHARASTWFESQGLIEESIRHALWTSDPDRAGEIVARHRFATLQGPGWYALERWLDMLPESTQQRPEILSARLFMMTEAYRLAEMPPLMEKMKNLLGDEPPDEALAAELDVHHGLLHLWHECDGEAASKRFERARERGSLKSGLVALRVDSFAAVARHMIGQGELAVASLQEQIRSVKEPESLAYLMRALTFVRLLSGDLLAAARDAERASDMAKRSGNPMLEAMSYYLLANSQFQAHQLSHALPNFVESAKKHIFLNRRFAIDALAGRIMTFQALHRFNDAVVALEELAELAKETGELHPVSLAESSRARLSLLQNDVEAAVRWANAYDSALVLSDTVIFLEVPVLTQCRAWIASGTRENLSRAIGQLVSVRRQVEALHFTPQVIEILVLQAVALEKKGMTDEAHAALDEAIAMGAPRGFVRPFIEGGSTMAALLDGRRSRSENRHFTHRLLAAFESEDRPSSTDLPSVRRPSSPGTVDSLTTRQIEILELLRKRLRDKEIAEELVISPATVHQHLKQIYRKLGVNGRRHAVEKAESLGILGSAVK